MPEGMALHATESVTRIPAFIIIAKCVVEQLLMSHFPNRRNIYIRYALRR